MSVQDFLYIIASVMDMSLIVLATSALHRAPQGVDSKLIVMPLLTGIAMLVMHSTGVIGGAAVNYDIRSLSWQLLNILVSMTMINNVKNIKKAE